MNTVTDSAGAAPVCLSHHSTLRVFKLTHAASVYVAAWGMKADTDLRTLRCVASEVH